MESISLELIVNVFNWRTVNYGHLELLRESDHSPPRLRQNKNKMYLLVGMQIIDSFINRELIELIDQLKINW